MLGTRVLDWDCCSRETWVVVGPSLGDEPMLLVEAIQADQHYYGSPIFWSGVDSLEAPSLADAVAAHAELVEVARGYGRCSCPWGPRSRPPSEESLLATPVGSSRCSTRRIWPIR